MSDSVRRALAVAVVLLAVTACRPISSGNGWEALATFDNKPVVRAGCTVHYKVNADTLPDRGRKLLGYDLVTVVHEQVAATSAQSGLRWVFDGYTHATYDGTGGTRSAKAWARSSGVLIELRWLDNGWGGWSQPLTGSDRSRYTGGIMWLNTRVFDLRASLEQDPRTDAAGIVAHELGHQSGLGDLYDSKPAPWPDAVVVGNKMGNDRSGWGRGDRAGFAALRPAGCR